MEFSSDEWPYLTDTMDLLSMGLKREIYKGIKEQQVSSFCHQMKLLI